METSAILSVSLFTKSLGPAINESVNQILDAMVASGLNQPLIASFKMIAMHIPRLRKEIQVRLFLPLYHGYFLFL